MNYIQYNIFKALLNRNVQLAISLFLVSAFIRILFLELYWPNTDITWDDEPDYVSLAEYIKSGQSWINQEAPTTRPVLLSLIISPLLDLGTHIIRISLVLISSLTPIFVFYLSKKAFGLTKIQSLLPSAIWAFYPPAIWYSGLILTESITSLLVTITALCLINIKESSRIYFVILTGITIGCLILARSSYVYLPMFIIAASICSKVLFKTSLINIKSILLIVGTVGLITSPIIIRNYNTIGSILPIESRLPYGLVVSNGDMTSPIIKQGGYDKLSPAMFKLSELNKLETSYSDLVVYAKSTVFKELRTNSSMIPQVLVNRTFNYWGSRPDPFDPRITINDIILGIIWIPILIAFLLALRFYKNSNFWIFMILILYAYLTTMIFWSSPRFRFPSDSLIIILASVSVLKLKPLIMKFGHIANSDNND
ncbi:MAG: hypothetical protein CL763_06775 [Chloroflexi bacterium]|nr:hypothetical protein [Chloroflexota bacterium]|tara:strand:+ start:4028 stop:5302 length:1275 start_codon:yes stop_codon:yes gene_type:complete